MIVGITYVIAIITLILAIWWEKKDVHRIEKIKPVNEIKNRRERERQYRLISKFPYENRVGWRMIYITSVAATFLVGLTLHKSGLAINWDIIMVIFLIMFISFQMSSGFGNFHFWRLIAGKVDPHIVTI